MVTKPSVSVCFLIITVSLLYHKYIQKALIILNVWMLLTYTTCTSVKCLLEDHIEYRKICFYGAEHCKLGTLYVDAVVTWGPCVFVLKFRSMLKRLLLIWPQHLKGVHGYNAVICFAVNAAVMAAVRQCINVSRPIQFNSQTVVWYNMSEWRNPLFDHNLMWLLLWLNRLRAAVCNVLVLLFR